MVLCNLPGRLVETEQTMIDKKTRQKYVIAHLNLDGELLAIQRDALTTALTQNIPLWARERVAVMKIGNEGDTFPSFGGYIVNRTFFIICTSRAEDKELLKLIGEQHGTNARKKS